MILQSGYVLHIVPLIVKNKGLRLKHPNPVLRPAELNLCRDYTIVAHSMQQVARTSARTAFFHLRVLLEHGLTDAVFSAPQHKQTEDYISGRIG